MEDNEEEKEYFGCPGHCFDIDGDLWHEPGSCKGPHFTISGPCCGYKNKPKIKFEWPEFKDGKRT